MVFMRGMILEGGLRVAPPPRLLPKRPLAVLKAEEEVEASENKALSSRPWLAALSMGPERYESPPGDIAPTTSGTSDVDMARMGVPGDSLRALVGTIDEAGLLRGSSCPGAPGSVLAALWACRGCRGFDMDLGGRPRAAAVAMPDEGPPRLPPASMGDEESRDSIRAAMLVGGAVRSGGGGAENINIWPSLRAAAADRSSSVQAAASIICSCCPFAAQIRSNAARLIASGTTLSMGLGEMQIRLREDRVDRGWRQCGDLIWL